MKTLILNATYEPLNICEATHALTLVLEGKAEVVEESDEVVRSPSRTFTLPAIVRLKRLVKMPMRGKSIPITRRTVCARDRFECCYCGDYADTIDHVVPRDPRRGGGPHTWENVVAACRRCNHRKRNRTPAEAGLTMRYQPWRPKGAHARLLLYAVNPLWQPYLRAA